MTMKRFARRDVLRGSVAIAASGAFASVTSAAPPPSPVTPEMIAAAKKEGRVVYYTSIDLPVAERIAKAFEARYPGIDVRVERTGAERVFQRIGQEYASRIHSVDVVNSSDAAHFIVWKREGILQPYLPEDVAQYYPVEPKWTGKIVKAHPSYSGTIMTATYQMARDLGWDYFEKLSKQKVMQVQSSADPPKKLALGERAVMADGNEYNMFIEKEKGTPVEIVYATEGSPLIVGPNGLFKNAPNPNAARLFQSFCFSPEAQQLCIDVAGLRSVHPQTKDKPGRKPFGEIKKMKDDPEGVERLSAEIKARYSKLFGV